MVCCNRGPAIGTGIEFLATYEQKRLAFRFNVERDPEVECQAQSWHVPVMRDKLILFSVKREFRNYSS